MDGNSGLWTKRALTGPAKHSAEEDIPELAALW
jgi:hypothetical protein